MKNQSQHTDIEGVVYRNSGHHGQMSSMTGRRAASTTLAAAMGLVLALPGCAALQSKPPEATPVVETAPKPVEVADYLAVFDRLAPGDPARQYATVAELASAAQADPTATNRLRYALALGAAGRADSNPIEAKRLISELLAEQTDLQPKELSLANAWLREFDARVALYADLARQREESERKLKGMDAEADKRIAALNAETQRLRKALADAERKLEAVAEMEQALVPPAQAPPEGQP
jgi:hypothetical protein